MKKFKTKLIQFRVRADQHQQIWNFANESHMDLSTYIREVSLLGYTFQMQANPPQEIQVASMSIERDGADSLGKSNRNATG